VVLLAVAAPVVWPLAAAYLIARCIHDEAIPGDNQFWITRPYRRSSLLAAKLMFIAVFVNLPILAVQTFQVLHAGFPLSTAWTGILWSQVLLILCLSLPAAALAAITPGLVAFMFVELFTAALIFGPFQYWFFEISNLHAPWSSGVEWISHSINLTLVAVAASAVLLLQFLRSRTLWSRIISASVLVAGVSVFLLLPPQLALNAEVLLTKPQMDLTPIQLDRANTPLPDNRLYVENPRIPIWISIHGIPAEAAIKVDGFSGVLVATGGATRPVYTNGADVSSGENGDRIVRTMFFPGKAFFEAHKNDPVTLRGALYFTIFGDPRTQTIPQQREPLTLFDRLRCSTGVLQNLTETRCTSAFRWPALWIGNSHETFYQSISYSPFPAELSLTPLESHSAMNAQGLAPPSPLGPHEPPPITMVALRPLAHVRRDVQFGNIHLVDVFMQRMRPPPPPPPNKTK